MTLSGYSAEQQRISRAYGTQPHPRGVTDVITVITGPGALVQRARLDPPDLPSSSPP